MVSKLARRIFNVKKYHHSLGDKRITIPSIQTAVADDENLVRRRWHNKYDIRGVGGAGQQLLTQQAATLFSEHPESEILEDGFEGFNHTNTMNGYHDFDEFENRDSLSRIQPCFESEIDGISIEPMSHIVDELSSSIEVLNGEHPEMYLPGFIIHIVPEQRRTLLTLWKSWKVHDREHNFKAYRANRENFKHIIVSPYMFLDHLLWSTPCDAKSTGDKKGTKSS